MPARRARPLARRSRFDEFAEQASKFVSRAAFFTISLLGVAIWLPTITLFHSIDTWQLVINTVTSVLAFLLVALLQNSERRSDLALHEKVDVLSGAVITLMSHQVDPDPQRLQRDAAALRAAIGLQRRI